MNAIEALLLGVVQGVTEFLPVSSSGHLVLFQTMFGIEGPGGLGFEVALHLATLVAILLVYRTRVVALASGVLHRDTASIRYVGKLAVATLPAVLVALTLSDWIEHSFASPALAASCLLVTAIILWTTRKTIPLAVGSEPGWGAALLIGCAQAFAILPGISRSGTTVAVALALGVSAGAAAEFSFLLGTIAMAGAAILILPGFGVENLALGPLLIGSAAALVSGVGSIALFLRLLEHRNFYVFSYYLVFAGGASLAYWTLVR